MHVTKNRGKDSCFPEHHWVALSMIYAFHPTTFFQLGVYMQGLNVRTPFMPNFIPRADEVGGNEIFAK